MKIAIASSGLGHISRGIETWACDTAVALAETIDNRPQTLDPRPKTEALKQKEDGATRSDVYGLKSEVSTVTLFCAAPLPSAAHCPLSTVILPCLKRGDPLARFIVRWAPGWSWRWGWKSGYELEQRSFWRLLWPILRDEGFDILHVQDPLLADLCRRYRQAGKLRTKEILAHGTEEPVEFLAKLDYVQHLAPWHLDQTVRKLEENRVG